MIEDKRAVAAIDTSVEVVCAVAYAISRRIGGNAFTGNGMRVTPLGRSGTGIVH